MNGAGALNITLGVVSLVAGLTAGILLIIRSKAADEKIQGIILRILCDRKAISLSYKEGVSGGTPFLRF